MGDSIKNYKLYLGYDGTNYHGWQIQKKDVTVQQRVEEALCVITHEDIEVFGCSRTDAGVHASNYVCNFFSSCELPAEKIPFAINTQLPDDIAAFRCEEVEDKFNARFSAKSKEYIYTIVNAPHREALLVNRAWHYPIKLNIDNMRQATKYLIGKMDFTTFMAVGGQQRKTEKEIYSIEVNKNGNIITIRFRADGYLYNMARIIVGTLVYVGDGKIKLCDMPKIIASKDRRKAGKTAPSKGLCLTQVYY